MKFYLPKREDKEAFSNLGEYARRTELITKMALAGWLTEQEMEEYLEGILDTATPYGNSDSILWCVDDPENMPFDARRAYIFEPLYNIVAFMLKVYFMSPSVMDKYPGFKKILTGAIISISHNTLNSETIYRLDNAGLCQFLYYNPDIDPALLEHFEGLREIRANCGPKSLF